MNSTTKRAYTLFLGLTIGFSTLMVIVPAISLETYAQSNETQASEAGEMSNMTNMTAATGPGGTIPSMSTPGEKTFYVFTTEVPNVDEVKLKIAGDSFDVKTLVVNKGDKVTVKFYNVDDVKTERHSFTIGDPYKVDIDLGFGENGNATFTADHTAYSLTTANITYP